MNDKIDMKTIFIDKMGVDYERLEKFAFMVFMCFSKETQDEIPPHSLQVIITKVFADRDVLKLVTIEKKNIKISFLHYMVIILLINIMD